jgi:hypothetical protein
VRIVPSTGRSSASCSRSAPALIAAATSLAVAVSRPSSRSRNPSRNCDSSIPELPRAASTDDSAIAAVT